MARKVLILYRDGERVQPYKEAALAAGLQPQIVQAGSAFSLAEVDGLLLMGGIDVNPALYGEEKHLKTDEPDPVLDGAELVAIEEALERDLPIFAICRGMQLLNVQHGGTLVQHLTPVQRHRSIKDHDRSLPVHSVRIHEGSLLERSVDALGSDVNSRHHQAVREVGQNLTVCGIAPDGVIEAIERPDRTFVLGVQWHPEDQIRRDPLQLKLFESFREAMGR